MGANGVRLFVPPFQDPVNPNLDPALVAGINLVGTQMASALYDAGMTGIAHQQTYDLWWHGGFRSTPTRHNMIGILTEAASTRLGSPITLSVDSVRQPGRSEEHTSELQSLAYLVCRLLLEKKKNSLSHAPFLDKCSNR